MCSKEASFSPHICVATNTGRACISSDSCSCPQLESSSQSNEFSLRLPWNYQDLWEAQITYPQSCSHVTIKRHPALSSSSEAVRLEVWQGFRVSSGVGRESSACMILLSDAQYFHCCPSPENFKALIQCLHWLKLVISITVFVGLKASGCHRNQVM